MRNPGGTCAQPPDLNSRSERVLLADLAPKLSLLFLYRVGYIRPWKLHGDNEVRPRASSTYHHRACKAAGHLLGHYEQKATVLGDVMFISAT